MKLESRVKLGWSTGSLGAPGRRLYVTCRSGRSRAAPATVSDYLIPASSPVRLLSEVTQLGGTR